MQVLFQQFTVVWLCQKWHCFNAFNAVIEHTASSATKCILDILPRLFLCSCSTSQTPIHVDDLKHRLIAAWSGVSLKLTVRATVIALKLQISFCQDSGYNKGERPYVNKRNIVFNLVRWVVSTNIMQLNLHTVSVVHVSAFTFVLWVLAKWYLQF